MVSQADNVKVSYSDFHKKNRSKHLYPTEWVIRTMLGSYPKLSLDRSKYPGGKILDLGFGDCRNMTLLDNCGLDIHGVEITEDILIIARETLNGLGIEATLKVGSNASIPFEDNYFDYLLASSSCYYVDANTTFTKNLEEMVRVLKPGGYIIANFPSFSPEPSVKESFILQDCGFTEDNHVIIKNDIYGIRNGYKFKAFRSKQELEGTFAPYFTDIAIGGCLDNYFGVQINALFIVAKKK